jgi:hypothetical protein
MIKVFPSGDNFSKLRTKHATKKSKYEKHIRRQATNPSSSAITEKMKSEYASGILDFIAPLPKPTPRCPPFLIAANARIF